MRKMAECWSVMWNSECLEVPFTSQMDKQVEGGGGNELAVSIKVTAIQSKSTGKLDLLEQNNRRARRAFYICRCVRVTRRDISDVQISPGRIRSNGFVV